MPMNGEKSTKKQSVLKEYGRCFQVEMENWMGGKT